MKNKTILWLTIFILTLAITPVLASCAQASAPTTPTAPATPPKVTSSTPIPALANATWVLQSYGQPGNLKSVLKGTDIPFKNIEITAVFDNTRSQVTGSSGVNSYGGGYELKDNKLSILRLAITLMAGPQPLMDQEREFFNLLQAAESYQIEADKLTISGGSQVLIFTRK